MALLKLSQPYLIFLIFLTFQLSATSRVKRYLAFPKGSLATVSVAMTTFLPKDILPPKLLTGLAHIIEYDFGYPIPDIISKKTDTPKTKPKKEKETFYINSPPSIQEYYLKFPDKRKWASKRKGRILKQLSNVIDRQGMSGESCIIRLACEIKENLKWGKSLFEDILLAIVPDPPSQEHCQRPSNPCPFSILHVLMHSKLIDTTG